jgi:hypothetical protein
MSLGEAWLLRVAARAGERRARLLRDYSDATTSRRDAREWGGASVCKTCSSLEDKDTDTRNVHTS